MTEQFVPWQVTQRRTGNPREPIEVQALRQELADTQKKLQGYADAAISLYNELRVLRESICKSCKERLVPNMAVTPPQVVGSAAGSSSSSRNRSSRSESAAEHTNFWRRYLSKRRRDRKGSPDRLSSATPNLPIVINSASPNTPVPPPESVPVLPSATQIPATLPPASEKSVTVSMPLSKPSTPEPRAPQWSVRRAATANTALEVTFVRSFTHKGCIMSVKFSTDGKYLASALGGNSGSVAIFEVETGKKVGTLTEYASQYSSGARPGFMCVQFSRNGRYLAIADMASRVMVWDVLNKRMCNIFRGHTSEVHSVDFSPNGRLVVSACCDTTVRIWNTRDGSAKVLSDNAQEFLSARFSPNGRYVAAGNYDRMLRIWDVRTGRLVKRWVGHDDFVCSVAFTADGKGLLSGGPGGILKCWDVSSLGMVQSGGEPVATELRKYTGHNGTVRCIVNSPDAKWIATASEDKTAMLWDTHIARWQCTLLGHEDNVFSIDFSPAGTYLATGSRDGHATLWRYRSTI